MSEKHLDNLFTEPLKPKINTFILPRSETSAPKHLPRLKKHEPYQDILYP